MTGPAVGGCAPGDQRDQQLGDDGRGGGDQDGGGERGGAGRERGGGQGRGGDEREDGDQALQEAQDRGTVTDAVPARDLLFLLIALANWAAVVPQMKRVLVGAQDTDRTRLRASVKEAARRLVAK